MIQTKYNNQIAFGKDPINKSNKRIKREAPSPIKATKAGKTMFDELVTSVENANLQSSGWVKNAAVRSFREKIVPLLEQTDLTCKQLAKQLKKALKSYY